MADSSHTKQKIQSRCLKLFFGSCWFRLATVFCSCCCMAVSVAACI
ncbi:hypothetical protein [Methanimicrococcus hongohii]|nr:hypothetical protein [Methanimicrococcus sp. Hf6]